MAHIPDIRILIKQNIMVKKSGEKSGYFDVSYQNYFWNDD
jgi:hypothetical protein